MQRDLGGFPHERLHQEAINRRLALRDRVYYKYLLQIIVKLLSFRLGYEAQHKKFTAYTNKRDKRYTLLVPHQQVDMLHTLGQQYPRHELTLIDRSWLLFRSSVLHTLTYER